MWEGFPNLTVELIPLHNHTLLFVEYLLPIRYRAYSDREFYVLIKFWFINN